MAGDLRTGKGHLVAMHLKETVPGKFREIPLGPAMWTLGKGSRWPGSWAFGNL